MIIYLISLVLCFLLIPIVLKLHDYSYSVHIGRKYTTIISPTASILLAILSLLPIINIITLIVLLILFLLYFVLSLPELIVNNELNIKDNILTDWMNGKYFVRNKNVSK